MEEEKKITIKNPKTGNPLEITIRLAKENEISEIIEIEQICFPPSEAAKKEDIRALCAPVYPLCSFDLKALLLRWPGLSARRSPEPRP